MARGGYRYGAGRPGRKVKAEGCLRLDVRDLARRDLLQDGYCFSWRWTNHYTGESAGSISINVERHALALRFSCDERPTVQRVARVTTPCQFGGSRPWLCCPRCDGRVAVLYLRRAMFACRRCQGVSYASQSEDVVARSWRRQSKLEARLGPDWRRPKGMHRATRTRLLSAILQCEEVRDDALRAYAARLGFISGLLV